jgi:malonate-semialdehyde dehydrogenase (acetylating)/methylmalonate-semialdehyde dehydrogenase
MAITTAVAIGPVGDALADALAARASAVVIGDGAAGGVDMGPLVSKASQDRVRGYVSRAKDAGVRVVIDRSAEVVEDRPGGYYVGPAVLDHVTTGMEVYRDEIFGPVLIIVRAGTLDEALDLIRTNPYGNGAAIFTRNGDAARKFQREAAAGMVGVNVPIPVPVAPHSVAGWKNSVFGDTGLNNGSWRFWTQPKYITTRWTEPASGVDLGFRPN